MRVLLVCHGYPPFGVAGVERLSAQTAEELTRRGHEVTVLTRRPSGAPPRPSLERETREGVPVVSISGGGTKFERFPDHEPALERIFERMLAEVVPDVVLITHLMHHSPGYVAIAQRWRIPVVLELHDFFAMCPRSHLQRRSRELCDGPEGGRACAEHCFADQPDAELRWALRAQSFAEAVRYADEVLAPSGLVADAFGPMRDPDSSPIQVVDDAVSPLGPVLRSKVRGELHLVSIGVTVEHKGFHVVVDALRRARLAASRYTIFGIALEPLAGALRDAAEQVPDLELRLFGRFSPPELPALLADADALVVPSLVAETYSIAAREAFACGLPVIASRIGALPDAIRPGENGWLFEPGDVFGLASLLRRLDSDRSLVRRAANGIRPDDMTSVASRTDRLETLLAGAVGRPSRHHGRPEETEMLRMREALGAADSARGGPGAAGS
jgi:glycosyltransferase involved in cell wall biosynthesis